MKWPCLKNSLIFDFPHSSVTFSKHIMTTPDTSSVEALNAAIQSLNPFDKPAIVTNQDIWGKGFPDVKSLNAHASTMVLQAVEQSRNGQCPKTSIALAAEPGVGKSHIISRIRHQLQDEGGALFIYAPFGKFSELNLVKYQFQQILAESLKQVGSQQVMQWQELASAIVIEASNKLQTSAKFPSPKDIVSWFSRALTKDRTLVERVTTKAQKIKPQIDPDIIKAILWTLSESHASYAVKWLSGKELAESKACELGLPNPVKEDREVQSFDNVRQILDLISDYNSLLVCFDEIDGQGYDDAGFSKAQVVSQLVKDLFDNLHKGVILTVMMPDTWRNQIKQLPQASGIPARVSAKGDPIVLRYMDGDAIVDLVSLWMQRFYEERKLVPLHPVYPFNENHLKELGKQKPTVRQVLNWCRDNFTPQSPKPVREDRVKQAFEKSLNEDFGDFMEDTSLLDGVLFFGFSTLLGQTIEGVEIKDVSEIEPEKENNGYINFKVIGKEKGKTVKIGVAIRQESHGKSVSAGMKRLIDYKKFGLTRGCLVRSKSIKPNWSAHSSLNKLLTQLGGEWVPLKADEVKPLLSAFSVYSAREDYELTKEEIFAFLNETGLVANNPLIREILSDPSGQIPTDVFDDEIPINTSEISDGLNGEVILEDL